MVADGYQERRIVVLFRLEDLSAVQLLFIVHQNTISGNYTRAVEGEGLQGRHRGLRGKKGGGYSPPQSPAETYERSQYIVPWKPKIVNN